MPKRLISTPSTPSTTKTLSLSPTRTPTTPPNPQIPTTFTDSLPLPSLIVFDLDYTLWPFWVDTHVSPPLRPSSPSDRGTHMLDRTGSHYKFYPGVAPILRAAYDRNITLGLASRTHAPELARMLLRGLTVPPLPDIPSTVNTSPQSVCAIDIFAHQQIYPGSKTSHFRRIQDATRQGTHTHTGTGRGGEGEVAFADMLFFDDEGRNRNVETELGVTFWLVPDGVSRDEVDKGVWEWRRRRRRRGEGPGQ